MHDDRTPGPEPAGEEPREEDSLDESDDAVIAADATGMLASERFITRAEIEAGLEGRDLTDAGDV